MAEPIENATEKMDSATEAPTSSTNSAPPPVKAPAATEPKTQPAPVAKIAAPEKKSDVIAEKQPLPAEPPVAKVLVAAKPTVPVNTPAPVTNAVSAQPPKPAAKAPSSQPVDEAINAILKP